MAPADNIPDVLQSSQSFVRALKSPADPPHEDGLSKIQIARRGWDSQTLYVPRKADLLLEWILTRFHKEKSKQSPENPLFDTAHWSLLADILSLPGDAHIVSLITRISIPGLVSSLLALHHIIPDSSKHSLFPSILSALNVLWPLAAQRAGLDPLLECLWQSLNVCNRIHRALECNKLEELLALLFAAFRSALDNANAAGKKKVYLALVQHQFHPWLRAMHSLSSPHPLREQLYSLGIEILFNADSLRTSLDTNPGASTGTDLFSSLFGSSIKWDQNSRTIFLELLPRVSESYFLALRKHRSTIYATSQSSQHTRSRHRDAGIRFGNACLDFLKYSEASPEMVMHVWGARVGVLAILEEEAVFDNQVNGVIADKVRVVVSDIIKILENAWDESFSGLVAHALNALTCLHRIEPDILAPSIPQILERLATHCGAVAGHSSTPFLSQLISYYAKTRTLHTFISLLLASVTSTFSFLPRLNPRKLYAIVARSPLLSLPFAEELSESLRAFMTPGQANATINSIHGVLESSFAVLGAIEPTRKRRKVSADKDLHEYSQVSDENKEYNLVKFVLVARLGATALSAVLLASVGGDSTERRKTCLGRVDDLISSALEASFRIGTGTAQKEQGKRTRDAEIFHSSWSRECFSTGLLGLWYDLFARSSSPGAESEGGNSWMATAVLFRLQDNLRNCLYSNDIQAELQLEIGRVLFACRVSQRNVNDLNQKSWPEFDAILDYIESSLPGCDVGSSQDMSPVTDVPFSSKKDAALSLWSLTLGRYLHAVDMHASPTQLERLADLMTRTLSNSGDQVSGGFVVKHAMASASFWEFSNVQTTLIACLERRTIGFSPFDFQEWLLALVQGDSKIIKALLKTNNKSLKEIEDSMAVYRLLHCFPPGYLSRTYRVELAKRALVTDIMISALNRRNDTPVFAGCQTILRSFVVLATTQTSIRVFNEIEWVPYLIFPKQTPDESSVNVTMNLLSLIYMSWLRAASSEGGGEDFLASVLTYFMKSNPFLDGEKSATLTQRSILRFICALVEFKITSFSVNLRKSFQSLCIDLENSLRPAIRAISSQPNLSEFLQSGHIIEAWQVLLSLKQWLLIQPERDTVAEMLLQKTGQIFKSSEGPDVSDEFRTNVFSLVMREGRILSGDDLRHIGTIASAYMLFTASTSSKVSLCDRPLAATIKNLSAIQFEAFLELVAEAMEIRSNEWSEAELGSLMHLSELLLREAPEKTSKLSHEHAARCLRAFVDRSAFASGSSMLVAQILDLIHFQCTERAAGLKASDIACIWSILARALRGSEKHDDGTSASIFQTIASIVNALIRLRRDLMSPHLPQLAMILRQLIMVIRGVRPLLGTKQYHLVSDSLPKWIDPQKPLGQDDARLLARVITSLSTKSLVRYHSNESQKAESLARPFAGHAPYVLLAYFQLMNDPLSVLPMTMRRELEPGLFALCDMMGENGRDTLMVQSLDVGSKALFKTLWKKYDKQRYVGGG